MSFANFLAVVEKYALFIFLALFSIFVLPNFAAFAVVPKEIFLISAASLLVVLWVLRMIVKGNLSFYIGKFDVAVILIALSYLSSAILATPNKMEAFLFPGTATFVLGGAMLYFIINQFGEKAKEGARIALFVSALLLSVSILLSQLNFFSKIPQLPAFMKDPAFNPMGGPIPSMIFIGVFAVFSLGLLLKEKDIAKKIFFGVSTAFLIFTLVLLVKDSLPGRPQALKLVNTQTSWEVAVEALKKNPIFGVGPSNYLTAFTLFRPVTYNQTDLWQIRYTTASNYYFTLLTETGFLGLSAFLILLFSIYKGFAANFKLDFEKLSLILMIVLFAFLPISPALLIVMFALLAIFSGSETKSAHLISFSGKAGGILIGLPILAGVAAILFFGWKVVSAEMTFKKSLDALSKNNAKETYNLMQKAISQNPKVDRYHATLAQVNMALAQSVANKKELTDTDRSTITQLVQQAIAQGKETVLLNPQRSGNWEVLAQIYKSIMPFAQGADQFAIQTYTQAVALDPINPTLRISLGGVYFALGRFDEAINSFKLAVLAKPDLANAHYNLAITYREKKDYDSAIKEMNLVLTLVAKDSSDYKLASSELENLQKKKAAIAGESESLSAPKPVEESNITPPIQLPSDSTPPTNQ